MSPGATSVWLLNHSRGRDSITAMGSCARAGQLFDEEIVAINVVLWTLSQPRSVPGARTPFVYRGYHQRELAVKDFHFLLSLGAGTCLDGAWSNLV